MGLAGIGDLLYLDLHRRTLTSNRRVGLGLAEGKELQHVTERNRTQVSEGVSTIEEVFNTACKYQIDMPITPNPAATHPQRNDPATGRAIRN